MVKKPIQHGHKILKERIVKGLRAKQILPALKQAPWNIQTDILMVLAVTLPLNHFVCREMNKYKSTLDLCQPNIPIYWTTQICQTIDRSNISPTLSIAICFYILSTVFKLKTTLQCELCFFLNTEVWIFFVEFPNKIHNSWLLELETLTTSGELSHRLTQTWTWLLYIGIKIRHASPHLGKPHTWANFRYL